MIILNKTKQTVLSKHATLADTVFSRLKGLLGKKNIGNDEALIITQCRSIHMFFMKFAIDVIFIDRKNIVVGVVKNIKPFQMSSYFFHAAAAIELPVGVIASSETQKGDQIAIQN